MLRGDRRPFCGPFLPYSGGTPYYATDSALTIGIQGPDAQERVNQLRNALSKLIAKHGWTTRDEPR